MIQFFVEDIDFQVEASESLASWLLVVARREGQEVETLNYVFCSDSYLRTLNHRYLNHDYFTDIVTFPLSDDSEPLVADLYISIDRVRENSQLHHTVFDDELRRVIVHGLLHLCGYDDSNTESSSQMRNLESFYLDRYVSST